MALLPRNRYLRVALIAAAVSVGINSLNIVADWYAVSPHGNDAVLWIGLFLVFPWLIALAAVPVSLIVALFRRPRKVALIVCLGCLVYLVIGFGCFNIGSRVRMHAFGKLAE